MILVETNCANKENASTIANTLFTEKLIAAANIFEIESMKLVEGEIKNMKEYRLTLITAQLTVEDVIKRVGQIHKDNSPLIWSVDPSRVTSNTKLWLKSVIDSF